MLRRFLGLLLLCPLFACASTSEVVSAPNPADFDLFTYHVAVPTVPAGTSEVVLRVATTESSPVPLSIHGLVGNAPFEFPPLHEKSSSSFACEQVALSFSSVCHLVYTTWELQATTNGKPIELDIRLGFPKGSTDVAALESALVGCTAATSDGRPIEAVTTRLARVR